MGWCSEEQRLADYETDEGIAIPAQQAERNAAKQLSESSIAAAFLASEEDMYGTVSSVASFTPLTAAICDQWRET